MRSAEISPQTGPQCQTEDWPTHKTECRRQNYILKVDLLPRFITNPRISRTLSCPATATFATLHQALLVAFGWANTHLYDFDIFDHNNARGHEHSFLGLEPIFKLTDLNTLDDVDFWETRSLDSSKVTLFRVLDNPETKGKTIHYNYDIGEGWEHVITCTGRTDPTAHFICLDGEGHGCAEDVGGSKGWDELLKAYDAQNPTIEQKEKILWFETFASNKDPEGLRGEMKWRWDKDKINVVLTELHKPSGNTPGPSSSPLPLLLISLDKRSFFDNMYAEVLAKIRSKVDVIEVTHIASAMRHLLKPHEEYSAIIVTGPEIMKNDFVAIQRKLVDYANAGGTVILGFHFSSFAQFDKLAVFFKETWGLNWEAGNYRGDMFSLNPRANPDFLRRPHPNLPQQYRMKALHLRNTRLEDRIYVSDPSSTQSPAIFAKYGNGYLGWIGDVNTENGTTELLLTMCGV